MSLHTIDELLDRTLVVVAHPDDECIGAGALLQRIKVPLVVFCTDAAPRDSYFWNSYGSREQYRQTRRNEAAAAAQAIGISRQLFLPITDQELYRNLDQAYESLEKTIRDFHATAILTLAYEGGHPDHDCCAFLSHVIAVQYNLPVWETALYHRTLHGLRQQTFLFPTEDTRVLGVTDQELARKQAMAELYKSQAHVLAGFDLSLESFRRQFQYDFSKPPAALINYEAWNWPMTANMLCAAFESSVANRP